MEELQSTEILDQEILEDARKKAHRILKAADETVQAKSAELDTAIAATLQELGNKYAALGKIAVDETMALLPLDRHRIKTAKIEEQLRAAVETWYGGLSRKNVLDLLSRELAKRIAECGAQMGEQLTAFAAPRVLIHKIDQAEAKAVLQEVLPGKTCAIETMQATAVYPEIILETQELRIYASIGKTVDYFLGEKRAELVGALLGETW